MSTIIGKELLPNGKALNDILLLLKEHGIEHYKLKIEKASETGDNYMGVIISVNIQEINSQNGKSLNLIVKYSPRSDTKDKLVNTNQVYNREITTYLKYLPNLYHLQRKYHIKDGLLPVAKMYRTSTTNTDEYLIMENIKLKGFRMRDKKIPFDFAHCKLVLTQLGYLHGLGYVWKTTESEKYQQTVEEYRINLFEHLVDKSFREFFNNMIQMACNLFDPETENVAYSKVKSLIDFGLDHYIINFNGPQLFDDKYSILIHGDCWNNNMMFKYDIDNNPIEICLLDWQISRNVSPAIELSYFIYLTTNTKLRNEHFDDLINIYYNALSDTIKKCNLNPEDILPFSVLQEHINKYFGFGIQFAFQIIPMILKDGKEIGEFTHLQDIFDVNSPFYKISNNELYTERLRGIILHGIEKGFI